MVENNQLNENSAAVQAHLGIAQSVIARMANNCALCKGWCIAIVSAVLVIIADKSKPDYTLIAIIPTIVFLALDAYYLALEKRLRESYNNFIEKLHKNNIIVSDLYLIVPSGSLIITFGKALLSFSVWPFYLMLLLMIGIAWKYIL